VDREAIEEFFEPFARVAVRRMFSGHGVYVDDACIAMILRGTIWLKSDETTRDRFEAAGCQPFAYEARGRTVTANAFWSLPEEALDDSDSLRDWCRLALQAARKTALAKQARAARKAARIANPPKTARPRRRRRTA
jgi:DNA transformation protein